MKLREVVILCAMAAIVYSTSSLVPRASGAIATCCVDDTGCTEGYRCDRSERCGEMPGQCIFVPQVVTPR